VIHIPNPWVHKLGRALEWSDLQRDRICAPHEAEERVTEKPKNQAPDDRPVSESQLVGSKLPPEVQPSPEQVTEIREPIDRLTGLDPNIDWVQRCREIAGVPGDMLTQTGAAVLIAKLRAEGVEHEQVSGDAAP